MNYAFSGYKSKQHRKHERLTTSPSEMPSTLFSPLILPMNSNHGNKNPKNSFDDNHIDLK